MKKSVEKIASRQSLQKKKKVRREDIWGGSGSGSGLGKIGGGDMG